MEGSYGWYQRHVDWPNAKIGRNSLDDTGSECGAELNWIGRTGMRRCEQVLAKLLLGGSYCVSLAQYGVGYWQSFDGMRVSTFEGLLGPARSLGGEDGVWKVRSMLFANAALLQAQVGRLPPGRRLSSWSLSYCDRQV